MRRVYERGCEGRRGERSETGLAVGKGETWQEGRQERTTETGGRGRE